MHCSVGFILRFRHAANVFWQVTDPYVGVVADFTLRFRPAANLFWQVTDPYVGVVADFTLRLRHATNLFWQVTDPGRNFCSPFSLCVPWYPLHSLPPFPHLDPARLAVFRL